MATETETVTINGANGAKANGKVKSKNQLRRLKTKQKKAEQGKEPVRGLVLAKLMFSDLERISGQRTYRGGGEGGAG